ncbi:S1 family peptidase [Streptomyces sp. NPDC053499]|uniref:S1 family peptidase n=1 Tax=Streptomyces sp. NPDC053499 TaxID=3365707 RepID=UPI0037D4C879
MGAAALLVTVAAAVPASAEESSKPLTGPARAEALAKKLGEDRTGGVYYQDGRLVVTVTDQAAERTVRNAGGTAKRVKRSAAELTALRNELDSLGTIDNTAWAAEAKTNRVHVKIFDGAPAAGRARIEKVAAAHSDAIRVDRVRSKLSFKATDIRGGNGIYSSGMLCSAGFNAKNSSGAIYTLTAGHCVPGTGNTWYMNWNDQRIGNQNFYRNGGGTDASPWRCGDCATVRASDSGIHPVGSVRYWGGTYKDITKSRFGVGGESVDRIGVTSQDKTGIITNVKVTVTIDGKKMYGMHESNVCALHGDSGGPLLTGSTALGLLSGGTDETKCSSSSSGTYWNYFEPVQRVLNERGLHVY